jgi:hypothetical protein
MAFEEGKQEPGIDAGFSAGTPAAAPAASSSPAAAAAGVNRQVSRQVKAASSKCRQLTADEALEIYRLRPSMKSPGKLRRGAMLHCKAVAPRFAVSAKTVREIWSGRSWTRVTRPEWTAAEVAARSGCWPEEHDGPETPIATPMPGLGSYGTLSTWHGLAAPGGPANGMQQVTAQMLQQARSIVPGMPGAPAYDFQVTRHRIPCVDSSPPPSYSSPYHSPYCTLPPARPPTPPPTVPRAPAAGRAPGEWAGAVRPAGWRRYAHLRAWPSGRSPRRELVLTERPRVSAAVGTTVLLARPCRSDGVCVRRGRGTGQTPAIPAPPAAAGAAI